MTMYYQNKLNYIISAIINKTLSELIEHDPLIESKFNPLEIKPYLEVVKSQILLESFKYYFEKLDNQYNLIDNQEEKTKFEIKYAKKLSICQQLLNHWQFN